MWTLCKFNSDSDHCCRVNFAIYLESTHLLSLDLVQLFFSGFMQRTFAILIFIWVNFHCAILTAAMTDMDAFEAHLAYARRRVWGSTFVPIWESRPAFPTVGNSYSSTARPSGVVLVRDASFEGAEEPVNPRVEALSTFRSKRAVSSKSWETLLNSQRVAAIRKWSALLVNHIRCFQLGRQWNRLTPLGPTICDGLKLVFAGKATGTLHNRVGPMLRYVHWCEVQHVAPIPLEEATVFSYMMSERETAAPTYLRSFLVAVRFCHHLLDLDGCLAILDSRRIQGCAKESYLKKRRTLRKDPLTVEMVQQLEALTGDSRFRPRDRVAAGCFLLCIYCRARFSDMQNLEPLILDEVSGSREPSGFIEGKVRRSKSAYTTEMKTMLLPMVAPRLGVSNEDWYNNWMLACVEAGKPKGEGVPMLPFPARNGWARVPIGPGEAADWLRQLLLASGTQALSLTNIGTHSLKATCLSWMAKHGDSLDIRRHLGYHMGNQEKVTLLYSRDAAARPLRALMQCLAEIRSGSFQPDNTRSGYFRGEASEVPRQSEEVAEDNGEADSSDSEDSQDDEDVYIGHHTTEEAVDHVVGAWHELATPGEAGISEEAALFRNKYTRYIHVAADESGLRFRCGREVNSKYVQLDERPKFMSPQCSQCFRDAS